MNNTCRICKKELSSSNHIESHILTRSQYIAPLTKSTSHKLLGYSEGKIFDPTHEIKDDKILCDDCDHMLGRYEDERGKLFKRLNESDFSYDNSTKAIDNLNSTKIKLACLADLFRCSITSRSPYQAISLGAKHEEKMIHFFENPEFCNPNDYPTIIFKLKMPFVFEAAQVPIQARIKGRRVYRTIMPYGWGWLTKVDPMDVDFFSRLTVDSLDNRALIVDCGDRNLTQSILNSAYKAILDAES